MVVGGQSLLFTVQNKHGFDITAFTSCTVMTGDINEIAVIVDTLFEHQ